MSKEKMHINIVVIGHVDSGKTTTTGHLVYKCGGIDKSTVKKFEKETQEMEEDSFKYAWILDKLKAERKRGVDIDIGLGKFETAKYCITIFDAPGHRDSLKNMIPGISQADCAVLIVGAGAGEFEAGFSLNGQTREHILLAFALGVKQLIVGVNKMESTEPPYSEARFKVINKEVRSYINKIGYNPAAVPIVPISGRNGDNMLEVSEKMPWFSGWSVQGAAGKLNAKCMVEALDAIPPPNRFFDKVLRSQYQNIRKFDTGTILVGLVESGILEPNTFVIVHVQNLVICGLVAENANNNPDYGKSISINMGFNVITLLIRELSCGFANGDVNNNPGPGDEVGFNVQDVLVEKLTSVFPEFPPLGRFILRDMGQVIGVGVIKNINFKDLPTGKITKLAEKDQKKK